MCFTFYFFCNRLYFDPIIISDEEADDSESEMEVEESAIAGPAPPDLTDEDTRDYTNGREVHVIYIEGRGGRSALNTLRSRQINLIQWRLLMSGKVHSGYRSNPYIHV